MVHLVVSGDVVLMSRVVRSRPGLIISFSTALCFFFLSTICSQNDKFGN